MSGKLVAHVRGNIVAYLALFVALTGTAFAAGVIPPNSVGTAQLKNGAVTGQKVADKTLTGTDIKLSALGTVPNSARVGGLLPGSFQSRVNGVCFDGSAMSQITATGAVSCEHFGQGTVTGVTAGTGLTGGGSSGAVTLNADPAVMQNRVKGRCVAGSAIAEIGQGGGVGCQKANVTQMIGGSIGILDPSQGGPFFLSPEGLSKPVFGPANEGTVDVTASNLPSTASNLRVHVSPAPGGAGWEFELFINQSVALGCAILGDATDCNTGSQSAAIPAGAAISFRAEAVGASQNPVRVTFGWTDATS